MSKQEDNAIVTDQDTLIDRKIDSRMKPILIMISSEHEQTRTAFKRLEDLVIRRRLFYRKVVLGIFLFVALVTLTGC